MTTSHVEDSGYSAAWAAVSITDKRSESHSMHYREQAKNKFANILRILAGNITYPQLLELPL